MSIASDTQPLTQLSATELASLIARGGVSSAEVVEAHIARCEQTRSTINALVQPMFDSARAAARQADAQQSRGQRLGLLHGVPISIKDCFAVQGGEVTLGIPGYSNGVCQEDSPLVARLRAAGAVILGKTNVPQAMLLHECDNPVYGRTIHPGDPTRSPGGSTGGEAALVAAGGSPLGLGSDLGGSIRQPAAACGLYGFKPTTGRLTLAGSHRAISRGMEAIAIQPGPLCRSAEDLALAMRVLSDRGGQGRLPDESCGDWKPDDDKVPASLRIAMWTDDGVFQPAVGVARAVEQAAEHLRASGVTVVEVQPPDVETLLRVYLGLISSDGMACVARLVHGGKVDAQLARQTRLAKLPRWLRSIASPVLSIAGQAELADLVRWTGARSTDGYWQLIAEAQDYRRSFWSKLEQQASGPLHATLSPAYGLPALRHGSALHLIRAASHTFLANLLGCPAGVAPTGHVSPAEEQQELASRISRTLGDHYARQNARASAGLPLAVEVMASAGHDATVLRLLREVGDPGAIRPKA